MYTFFTSFACFTLVVYRFCDCASCSFLANIVKIVEVKFAENLKYFEKWGNYCLLENVKRY